MIDVLLIGTIHFANPGRDQHNVTVDDVLTPKRQAEIADVVDALLEFRPTKVAVESSEANPARYGEYVAGRVQLRRSEVEQIGFRVARRMGHGRMFGIDIEHRYYELAIEQLITGDPYAARWAQLQRDGERVIEDMQAWLRSGPIGEVLYRLNAPDELERAWSPYEQLRTIASVTNDVGPRMVANWELRNALIVEELLRVCAQGDRALVIFGQGHVPPMHRELARRGIAGVDPLRYLAPFAPVERSGRVP